VLSFYGLFSQFLQDFVNNCCVGNIFFFLLFTEITSLILKNDIDGQEQGAMAKFQLTGSLYKKVHLACVGSEGMIQNYCQQQG
jgi:hypothetical protein